MAGVKGRDRRISCLLLLLYVSLSWKAISYFSLWRPGNF